MAWQRIHRCRTRLLRNTPYVVTGAYVPPKRAKLVIIFVDRNRPICPQAYREKFLSESDVKNFVKPTIDYVLSMQYPSKNIPSSVNSNSYDILVQWCHGAPGAIHMTTLAYQVCRITAKWCRKFTLFSYHPV